jgi:hypothetical protein
VYPAEEHGLRILLINQYYPPDSSATAHILHDLVSRLAGAATVRVLAGRPSYDPVEWRRWRLLSRECAGPVRVERVGSTAFDRRRMQGRVTNYLSFLALAATRGVFSARSDVVVVASDPPLAVWAAILAARGRPVVYSLRDLHPDHAIACGMMHPGLGTRVWDGLHRAALARCHLVVCVGETMAEHVLARGVAPGRVAVVPDGAWPPLGAPDPVVVSELRGDADFVVAHAGNIGGAGAWETLASAAQMLRGETEFLFVGNGSSASQIRDAGLRVVPFRPSSEIPSVMAAGDLQVVSVRDRMEGAVVPSKLYTALAHGRPILAVVPPGSDVAGVVREWGCGLVAAPDCPEEVAAQVRWAREHPDALAKMAGAAAEAGRHFERGRPAVRVAGLVRAAAGRGTTGAEVPRGTGALDGTGGLVVGHASECPNG